MTGKMICRSCGVAGLIAFLSLLPTLAMALTPEQVITLKKSGVSDETIQMMIRQEETVRSNQEDKMGSREVRDAQGNTVIIYSTGHSPRPTGDDPEKKKLDNAWKMLQNMNSNGHGSGAGATP